MQQAADHIMLLKMKSKIFSILCGCTRRKAQQYIEHWHHFLVTGPESLKRRYSSLQRQWGDSYEKSWLPHKKKMNLDVKYRQPLKKSMSTRT